MTARKTRLIVTSALCLALGACAGVLPESDTAPDEPTKISVVVVLKGKKTAAVRTAIEEALRDDYEVLPYQRYRDLARELGATKFRVDDVAEVAGEMGVDAVLTGIMRKKGKRGKKRYVLKLRLRDGSTGETIEHFKLKLKRRDELPIRDEEKLVAGMFPLLDEFAPQDEADDEADDSDEDFDDEEAVAEHDEDAEPPPAEKKAKPVKQQTRVAKAAPKKTKAKKPQARKAKKPVKVAKKRAPAPEEKTEQVEELSYDDEGQVIDDEVPGALANK